MAILINTAVVSNTADQIDTANKKIRDDLSGVDSAIRSLQQNWEGEAASSCTNKYDYIKRNFADARFSVVNDLVTFIRKQVDEGYETTEKAVSSAAAAFK